MARTIVGVLRGGTSDEYDASLKTGAVMLVSLPEETYDTRDILIDKKGLWHMRGVPAEPSRILAQVDVVLNGLHGGVGEDGSVHRILEQHGVAYAGSRALAASLSHNKARTMEIARAVGIAVPRSILFSVRNDLTTGEMAKSVFATFGPPYIVKPPLESSLQGMAFARTLPELPDTIGETLDRFGSALVQEFIRGEKVRVGVIENFRGQELYALPPAHMLNSTERRFQVPSTFSNGEKRVLEEIAKAAHRALNMSHFSHADLMLSHGRPYLLRVISLPGLYQDAEFPHMLEAVGSSVPEFLEHAISLARM